MSSRGVTSLVWKFQAPEVEPARARWSPGDDDVNSDGSRVALEDEHLDEAGFVGCPSPSRRWVTKSTGTAPGVRRGRRGGVVHPVELRVRGLTASRWRGVRSQ